MDAGTVVTTGRVDVCVRVDCYVYEGAEEPYVTLRWSSGYCAPDNGEAVWIEPGECPCRPGDLVIIEYATGRIRCGQAHYRGEAAIAWVLPTAGQDLLGGPPAPWICSYRSDGRHVYA